MLPQLAGDTVKVTVTRAADHQPPISARRPHCWRGSNRLVAQALAEASGHSDDEAGATDGMYTRSAGIPTYGISAIDEDPDDVRAHGKDERVGDRVVLQGDSVLDRIS